MEETPNPSTVKFLPGRTVLESGTAEFVNSTDAKQAPLAQALFNIDGVSKVFFGQDFISVTKADQKDWLSLKTLVLESLMNYFVAHEHVEYTPGTDSSAVPDDLADGIEKEIRELIESRVRPAVAMDGGDIVFERFEDGVVYLKMMGACDGCPSSSVTLQSGIEQMLRYYIPEVKEVRAAA